MNIPHLGIHSKYEVCSGSRSFEDYIKKAKFLGIDTIGIADKNTLGGTFALQTACQKANMNFVLGETVTVKRKEETYDLILYVKNKGGWRNLLRINKAIKVDNDGFVDESEILTRGNGLICVIPVDSVQNINRAYFYKLKGAFKEIYFQLDITEWIGNERDKNYLLNLQHYFKDLYPQCPPVLIHDSYYLDKEDAHIKQKLNTIGKVTDQYLSNDQYFKNSTELKISLSKLFKEGDDMLDKVWQESVSNALEIAKKCKFEIQSEGLKIPTYKMSELEAKKFKTNEDLFLALIFEGLEKIGKSNDEKYLLRIEEELSVIKKGGFIDYFLILLDVYRYMDENNITRGIGRGSIGGSLIAYCIDLIKIDPMQYSLLFSRFLNEARIMKTVEKEMIILETDQGEIELLPNKEVNILRNLKKISILAKELEINDEFV